MKNNKWLTRLLSILLVLATVVTSVPPTVLAQQNTDVVAIYGDVNADEKIDLNDILVLKKYILGIQTDNINLKYADVNDDGQADLKDLLSLKKYLAQWDIELGPGKVTVSFYDGDRLIDQLQTVKGDALGMVPANEKTSKADGIFLGWYTDPEFKNPFYADVEVNADTKVYAKYSTFTDSTLTVTSFAQLDLDTDASFTVVGDGDIRAITLIPMDGSETVKITITGEGPYTVTAEGGFNKGASYELTLPEGLNFVGSDGKTMPDTIRTASFSIKQDPVSNIQMREDVHFVQHATPSQLKAGDTVTLSGAQVDQLICFYHTTSPKDRDYTSGNAYLDDPETWFKVAEVNGDTVTLAELDEDDNDKMYDVPDNFPVKGQLPTGETGTLTLEADTDGYVLDLEFYAQTVGKEEATIEKALEKLSVGDFISIFVSTDSIESQDDIYFGKITAIEGTVITYVKSSAKEIEESADLYVEPVLKGDDMISQETKDAIEQMVLEQLKDSDFAEEAAYLLADLATKTDGFRNMEGIRLMLTDENGKPLSDEDITLMNLGASFELSDDIELTVELITSGDQLHFQDKGSVQLAIGINATFEVEVEDDGKVVIDLSATFVQELGLGISANGSIVKKEILFIPIPVGVKVGATLDLLSYTGIRVDVRGYTVAPEDESLYDQFMDVVKNPEKLGDVLADMGKFGALADGLKTVGDVFDKIEELEEKIQELQDDTETAIAYAEDVAMLWQMVDEMATDKKITKEEWEQTGKALGKTNVSGDLMEMLNLSTETELDTERYAESLADLLQKYSEMLEKETDWVTLVEQEMFRVDVNILGMVIYCKADFVVKADINIAMGTSLEYQVGKRYNFWFKIGLFKPESGSTTMDLVDESFAFQFYVMGKLGMKMGIKATAGFAIGSSAFARVGLSIEMGPYVKLYGFFIYSYERWREANKDTWTSHKAMAGALFVEFGLYLEVSLEAAALGDLFEVEFTFIDEEFPLLEAGQKNYPYGFHYEPMEDELVLVLDDDGNSTNGISMLMPDDYRAVNYCNLTTGYLGAKAFEWDNYNITLSNPAFSLNEKGEICVDVPENTRYMECDMTLTYKYGKLAFSTYDMQVVIPLVWTNLSMDEISQYYTASVRVGNELSGYDVVWSKRVRKNEEFQLPTEEELKELIGYEDWIYSSFSYPDAGKTVSVIANTSYDCTVTYTEYSLTVSGIENDDGTTSSQIFKTVYGGTFDFSALANTGTNIAGDLEIAKYTQFAGVVSDTVFTANGQEQVVDLSQPITGKVAAMILSGEVNATATYADNSVLVTYVFTGIDAPDYAERIRKGTASEYDIFAFVADFGMSIKNIDPAMGNVYRTTTYYVECGEIVGEKYTLSFEENGGAAVNDLIRVVGSAIGKLPTPVREGYTFVGWYADAELTTPFSQKLMPGADTTLYAKWKANQYDVTLNVNGGNQWEDGQGTVKVTFGEAYGKLPVPTRDGHSFQGWYTTQTCDDGTEVTESTVLTVAAAQTLYAKWHKLVQLEANFSYTAPETNPVYSKGVQVEILPNEDSWPAGLDRSSFTIKFMRQGETSYIEGYPVNAGTYDVTITREADDYYAPFSQTVTGVLTIDKATRTIGQVEVTLVGSGFTTMDLVLAEGTVDDLHPSASIVYAVDQKNGDLVVTGMGSKAKANSVTDAVHVSGLYPATEYAVLVYVSGDPNYHDAMATGYSYVGKTKDAPTDSWRNHMEPFEIVEGVYEYTITTPGQLAYLAYLVNTGKDYASDPVVTSNLLFNKNIRFYSQLGDYTFKLGADLDLSAYAWEPIGRDTYVFERFEEIVDGVRVEYNYYWYQHFGGNFDGNGYTITGMYVDGSIAPETDENSYTSDGKYAGLFGKAYADASITDVTIRDSYVTSESMAAAVVCLVSSLNGEKFPLIANCDVEATVRAKGVGGVVGNLYGGELTNSVMRGRVHSIATESDQGGVVGYVSGLKGTPAKVNNCVNYAELSGNNIYVGGIAGSATYGNIMSCVNYGNVTGYTHVGGIVGKVDDSADLSYGNVVDCVNYGTISSAGRMGGIVGYVIVGRIVNSANFGEIKGSGENIGGITGQHSDNKNAKTMNCVNYAKVTSSKKKYVGSVIGRNTDNSGTVAPVYYNKSVNTFLAAGTSGGASTDEVKNLEAHSFNTVSSALCSNLNGWSQIEEFEATEWVDAVSGYGYIPESVFELITTLSK